MRSSYLRSGFGDPLLFGGALDLRIVRIVHLIIILVRDVLDLLHAAFARNVCRYYDTQATETRCTHLRELRENDVHEIANNMAVGKRGGEERSLLSWTRGRRGAAAAETVSRWRHRRHSRTAALLS